VAPQLHLRRPGTLQQRQRRPPPPPLRSARAVKADAVIEVIEYEPPTTYAWVEIIYRRGSKTFFKLDFQGGTTKITMKCVWVPASWRAMAARPVLPATQRAQDVRWLATESQKGTDQIAGKTASSGDPAGAAPGGWQVTVEEPRRNGAPRGVSIGERDLNGHPILCDRRLPKTSRASLTSSSALIEYLAET